MPGRTDSSQESGRATAPPSSTLTDLPRYPHYSFPSTSGSSSTTPRYTPNYSNLFAKPKVEEKAQDDLSLHLLNSHKQEADSLLSFLQKKTEEESKEPSGKRRRKENAMSHYPEEQKRIPGYDYHQWDAGASARRAHLPFSQGWGSMGMGNPYFPNPHMMPAHAHSTPDYRFNQWAQSKLAHAHSNSSKIAPSIKSDPPLLDPLTDLQALVGNREQQDLVDLRLPGLPHSSPEKPVQLTVSRSEAIDKEITSTNDNYPKIPSSSLSKNLFTPQALFANGSTTINKVEITPVSARKSSTDVTTGTYERPNDVISGSISDPMRVRKSSDVGSKGDVTSGGLDRMSDITGAMRDARSSSDVTSGRQNELVSGIRDLRHNSDLTAGVLKRPIDAIAGSIAEARRSSDVTSGDIARRSDVTSGSTSRPDSASRRPDREKPCDVTSGGTDTTDDVPPRLGKPSDVTSGTPDDDVTRGERLQKSVAAESSDASVLPSDLKGVSSSPMKSAIEEKPLSSTKSDGVPSATSTVAMPTPTPGKEDSEKMEVKAQAPGLPESSYDESDVKDTKPDDSKPEVCPEPVTSQAGESLSTVSSTSTDVRPASKDAGKKKSKAKKRAKPQGKADPKKAKIVKPAKVPDRRGPLLHVKGTRDNPVAVTILNGPRNDEDDATSSRSRTSAAPRPLHRSTRSRQGLYCSTLSARYDARTVDPTWICVFCKQGPHKLDLGDLFGPYVVTVEAPSESWEESGDEKEIVDAQRRGGRHKTSIRKKGLLDYYQNMSLKPKRTKSDTEAEKLGLTPISDDEAEMQRFEVWVHEPCIVWSPGVSMVDARLLGLQEAVWHCQKEVCSVCSQAGANLGCIHRNCPNRCHYSCARDSDWHLPEDTFISTCQFHVQRT